MCRITNSAKRNKMKIQKSRFGKFNLENDVIHDAHKVIFKTVCVIFTCEMKIVI